jgi:cbb3-type cytochrome oxidase subunit 1
MFMKPNSASVNFVLTATGWLVVGVLMGLVLALEFVFPDMTHGESWLVFGRLRQAHINVVMFAFLSGAMMGSQCVDEQTDAETKPTLALRMHHPAAIRSSI